MELLGTMMARNLSLDVGVSYKKPLNEILKGLNGVLKLLLSRRTPAVNYFDLTGTRWIFLRKVSKTSGVTTYHQGLLCVSWKA